MTIKEANEIGCSVTELETGLAQFTGTEHYYKNFLGLLYTDGVKYLAEAAGAYWLIDAIASWQPQVRRVAEDFQLWDLTLNETHGAVLTARPDCDQPPMVQQQIDYTSFPLKSITLFVENGVLLLPSEH